MKKKLFLCICTALFVFGCENVFAQNTVTLKNDRGALRTITYSDEMIVHQHGDQCVNVTSKPKVKHQVVTGKQTHLLTVYAPTEYNWDEIWISDGTDVIGMYMQGEGDSFELDLEEDTYYVICYGWMETNEGPFQCFWVKDDIELTDDTDVFVDFNQCVYDLKVDYHDEHGTSFADLNFFDVMYSVNLYWLNMVWFISDFSLESYVEQVPYIRFNCMNSRNVLELVVFLEPGDQKSYLIKNSQNGLNESPVFTVNAEDVVTVREMFNVCDNPDSTLHYCYHTDILRITDGKAIGMVEARNLYLDFDLSLPYTIVTNAKEDEETGFESGPKMILMPTIHEWVDPNSEFRSFIRTPLYINNEGLVIREAITLFKDGYDILPRPVFFPSSPAKTTCPNDMIISFGERTPLATFYPRAFNAQSTPLNRTCFWGGFFFSGEYSCERHCDYDSNIQIMVNGDELYNDSIYKYNQEMPFYLSEPGEVVVEVNNEHLSTNGVNKTNRTHVEFDLGRADAMPPTMTFLRLLDEDGDETISLQNPSLSTLVFGCGDYSYHYTPNYGGYYDYLEYSAKPEVELFYTINGEQWEPISVIEDESLFYNGYGNVFVADLSQLGDQVVDKWVSLRFNLSDAAGNTQTQTLENVFFAGEWNSVEELPADGLSHQVFPNPFTNEVRITTADVVNGSANVQVYNVLGAQVYQKTVNCKDSKEFVIDGSTLKSGIYFYRISTKKGQMRGKIVKK